MIESMDKKKFQAWVLFYPSALELKHLSDGMYDTLNVMQRTFKPKKVLLVAHSMGGLVATAAVERYNDESPHDYLKLFVTIASPLGGMSSAKLGVEYAPTVMPCWEDLAPGSDFFNFALLHGEANGPLHPVLRVPAFRHCLTERGRNGFLGIAAALGSTGARGPNSSSASTPATSTS